MNSKKACERIKKIEKKYFKKFYINEINFWPLLRLLLWKYLISSVVKNKKTNLLIFFENIIKKFILNFKVYSFFKNNTSSENIFFSKKETLCYSKIEKKYYDRIIDPIFQASKKKIKLYYDTDLKFDLNLKFKSSRVGVYFNILESKKYLDSALKDKIKKICKENKINPSIFMKDFRNEINEFFTWYSFGNKLFKKYKFLKKLYVYPWYSSRMMGLISASKKFNVLSYDIQHGIQGSHQAMYTHWMICPDEGYEMVPSNFLVWNKITKKYHLKNNSMIFKKKHMTVLNKNLKFTLNKKDKKKNNIKKILFCAQPLTLANNEIVPKFIVKFIKKYADKKLNFIIRLHPNNRKNIKQIFKLFDSEIRKNFVIIDDARFSIYESFKSISHCISSFSTVSVEASDFGIKSAVFGEDAELIMKDFLKEKNLSLIKKNENSLKKWIIS